MRMDSRFTQRTSPRNAAPCCWSVLAQIITREYLNIDRMNAQGDWEGMTDWCFEELKQALEQKTTFVVPFVEVGFHEGLIPIDDHCYTYASKCPPPVNRLFDNDFVGDSDDYFEATIDKLANKIRTLLENPGQ